MYEKFAKYVAVVCLISMIGGSPKIAISDDLREQSLFISDRTNKNLPIFNEWLANNYKRKDLSILSTKIYGCPTNWWGGVGEYNNFDYLAKQIQPKIKKALQGFSTKAISKCREVAYIVKDGQLSAHHQHSYNHNWTKGTIFLLDKATKKTFVTIAAFTSNYLAGGKKATLFNNNLEKFCEATIQTKRSGELDCSEIGLGRPSFDYKVSSDNIGYYVFSDNKRFKLFATNLSETVARQTYSFKLRDWK